MHVEGVLARDVARHDERLPGPQREGGERGRAAAAPRVPPPEGDGDRAVLALVQEHEVAAARQDDPVGDDPAVLFSSEAEDTAHSGLSQLPLPIVTDPLEVPAWVLLELIRGLSTTTFVRLADDVAALAVGGLSTTTEADPAPPRVDLAAASSPPGEPLVVVARGTPGALGAFRVGTGPWVPMAECSPGTYRGSLVARSPGRPEHLAVRLVAEGGGTDEVRLPWAAVAARTPP